MNQITLSTERDTREMRTFFTASVDDVWQHTIGPQVFKLVMEKIADAIAAEYVKTHQQDILAAIDAQAVANLAVADAAASIRKTVDIGVRQLHRDMEDAVDEMRRPREVLTPGWFGVKRSVIR